METTGQQVDGQREGWIDRLMMK